MIRALTPRTVLSPLTLLAVCLLAAPAVIAKDFRATYSSVSGCCGEDLNQDGTPGPRARAEGRGTQGPFTQDTVLDIDPTGIRPAAPGQCEESSNSIIIPIIAGSSVVRFKDRSLQFKALAQDGRESFACFNFVAGASTGSILHWDITGGTGRFEGATGTAEVTSRFITQLSGLLVLEAEEVGEIQGGRGRKDDDDDDD